MTQYLTTVEVADILRTPRETVRYWRHVGKGPKSFKVGRRVLYAREDVEAFIAVSRGGGRSMSQPSEPTGLGAVVEDADGDLWVKWSLGHREDRNWKHHGRAGDYRRYGDITAVRVLSDGVQP